ncbi:MAG: hypothetical protein NUW01_09330, partial [Gemmatimonadaceae bacterium]|nr:hypothetical protein [Gemmatimonadaceae bacterium]
MAGYHSYDRTYRRNSGLRIFTAQPEVDSDLILIAACYGAGTLASLLAWRSGRLAIVVGHGAALAGSVVGLHLALAVLLGDAGTALHQPLPPLFPFARMSLRVDG